MEALEAAAVLLELPALPVELAVLVEAAVRVLPLERRLVGKVALAAAAAVPAVL